MGDLSSAVFWEGGAGLGGLPRSRIIKRLVRSREALHACVRCLGHPHAADFSDAACEVLEAETWAAAKFWAERVPATEKPEPLDVVIFAALRGNMEEGLRRRIFGGVSLESDLTGPTTRWLARNGLRVAAEVPVGNSRADLVGYAQGLVERDIAIVELKNSASEVERLADQLRDYGRACDRVQVVMTAQCLADVSVGRGELAQPRRFLKAVERMGGRVIIYDAVDGTFEEIAMGVNDFESRCYDDLWNYLCRLDEAAA